VSNPIYSSCQLSVSSLDASCLSHQGRQLAQPALVLAALVGNNVTQGDLVPFRPQIAYTGVHSSATGIIQDPAGVSIGSGERPHDMMGVGGSSLQIYKKFADLDMVPAMPVGASVFNTSLGAGARVLHTYSPQLGGSPGVPADAKAALEQLARAYANSFEAALNPTPAVKASGDSSVFNLSPLAGKIFAGSFKDQALDHLHPSYTLMAILLAQAWLLSNKRTPPACVLHYYQAPGEHQFDPIADALADGFYPAS
jgi:hypothetical protein